jgi:hypothetical protein
MVRRCQCGATIPPQTGRGRPRTKCVDCSPPIERPQRRKHTVTPLPAPERKTRTLESAVRDELDAYGRADSPDGVTALYAARMLDAGGHTGSAASSLMRELRACVVAATKGASMGTDLVDELRAKRDRRRGA